MGDCTSLSSLYSQRSPNLFESCSSHRAPAHFAGLTSTSGNKRKYRARGTSKQIFTTVCSTGKFHLLSGTVQITDPTEQDDTCKKSCVYIPCANRDRATSPTATLNLLVNGIFFSEAISSSQGYIYISLHGFCCTYFDMYLFSPALGSKIKWITVVRRFLS